MILDVFGKTMKLAREYNTWVLYDLSIGETSKSLVIVPRYLSTQEAIGFLDDLFHEFATPEHPEIRVKH